MQFRFCELCHVAVDGDIYEPWTNTLLCVVTDITVRNSQQKVNESCSFLSFRCHTIIKISEHAPEIFRKLR